MTNLTCTYFPTLGSIAVAGLVLVASGCATEASPSDINTASGGSSAPGGGSVSQAGSGGSASGTGGGGGTGTGKGGSNGAGSGTGGSGTSGSGTGGSGGGAGAGGTASSGAAGMTAVAGSAGASSAPTSTPDLIGPGGATCGNVNATHDDGWMCILSAPQPGANIVGAWFDYAYPTQTSCAHTLKKPSGGTRQICYSGGTCSSAAAGAGLGFSICDVHGVDVSTWPEMKGLITSHSLSTTGKSAFGACNTGAKISAVSWTFGSGSTPAGMSVVFQDASDTALGRVDSLAAGATSAAVPATVDPSKIASIHFTFNGAIKDWNFCLSTVKISY
jgi:hypothetical protein